MSSELFNKDELTKFIDIFNNLENNDEFEIMFGSYAKTNQLTMKNFLDILKNLTLYAKSNKLKIVHSETLDISYNYDSKSFNSYRISIHDINNINSLIAPLYKRQNNIIFTILTSKILSGTKNLEIINKKKNFDNIYNIDDFDIRVRLAKEDKLSKKELNSLIKLDNIGKLEIIFRMKSRVTIILESNTDIEIKIDLTSVKSSNNINNVYNIGANYELELEVNKKKKLSAQKNKLYLQKLLDYILFLKKIVEQSNHLVSKTEKTKVINLHNKLLNNDTSKALYINQVKSLEIVHLIDYLPNQYSVTDKADGDRCLGIIIDSKLYFIFSNMSVKYSGIKNKSLKSYDNTIIDGEYIFNSKLNKYIFASFDILYYKNKDIRNESNLYERYLKLQDVISKCFNFSFNAKKYDGIFNINKIESHYKKNISDYLKYMMGILKKTKEETFVCFKYIIFVLGGSDIEIFKYSEIIWNSYTKIDSSNVPYILDGLIYTPLYQIYTKILKETKLRNYKWKPSTSNSIDFYVTFEKDPKTGKYLNIYDDSSDHKVKGQTYKILNLHVGKLINNKEIPVLFEKNKNLHIAKIDGLNNEVRDLEGELIQDNTVVEFYYNNDGNIDKEFRWVPIRTRWDKTESVYKYKKKYGNNLEVSKYIWNSIIENITMDNLSRLGNEKFYENELNELKKRINASVIAIEKTKDIYYQKITNLGSAMRNFHNYIKSNLAYNYCSPKMVDGKLKKLSVLDIGCGRGGDLMKFFSARIKDYVGFDPDSHGIYSATDGCMSRFNNFRKKFPNWPNMKFLVADGGVKLNLEDQSKVINKMTEQNKKMLKEIFGNSSDNKKDTKFDVFNCSIAIHYLFKDDITWGNFCDNINSYINDEGYLTITTFDGNMLHKLFQKNNGVIEQDYLDKNGNLKKLFKYTATYDTKNNNNKLGLSYNAYVALFMEEGNYEVEYIVPNEYIVKSLKDKCNLELIESDNFYSIYEKQKSFFENVAPNEEKEESRRYFANVAKYYNLEDNFNKACIEFTKLHCVYVFKKNSSKKLKGGGNIKKSSNSSSNLISQYLNTPDVIDI